MHRHITIIMKEIVDILNEEGKLNTKQILIRTRTNRSTLITALEFLKDLNIVKEIREPYKSSYKRIFSLTPTFKKCF